MSVPFKKTKQNIFTFIKGLILG